MRPLHEAPRWAQRVITVTIVAYFVIWIASFSIESMILTVTHEVLFGLIAIGIGALIYVQSGRSNAALLAAGVLLIIGGLFQLVSVGAYAVPALEFAYSFATLFIFAGIAAYVYAVWIAR